MPDLDADLTALPAETLLGAYDDWVLAERLARHDGRPLRSGVPALRAELLRRLRIVDAATARLNALVDADAVGRSTPAAVAEIEVLFRLTTGAPPPQP